MSENESITEKQIPVEGREPRVLVVEDSPGTREFLRSFLDFEGFEVTTARNGYEALLKIAGGGVPDVIITDLTMPRMDGWELVRQCREDAALASVPIIVMSAVEQLEARRPEGVTAALAKPVDMIELMGALESVLKR